MLKNRIFSIFAVAALLGAAACDSGDEVEGEGAVAEDASMTTTEVITETDTTMAPVVTPVVTTDTGLVETTVETDVDVSRDTVIEP